MIPNAGSIEAFLAGLDQVPPEDRLGQLQGFLRYWRADIKAGARPPFTPEQIRALSEVQGVTALASFGFPVLW